MAIHVGDYIDQIRARIEPAMLLQTLAMVTVNVGPPIFFDDGMQLNGGFRVFDPQSHTWSRMDSGYFPGDFDTYWPGRPGWVDPQ
jgi:hypothetical protein